VNPPGRPRLGLLLAGIALVGLGVAVYLALADAGASGTVCVIGGGCEEVRSSSYSHLLGIPLGVYGIAWSTVALAASLAWWWTAARIPLYLLYAGGLVATVVEAYLVYVQLFVIDAVCSWCVLYGATVVLGWLGACAGVARSSRRSVTPPREPSAEQTRGAP
jgi:uncharacterized membrane protein